MFRQLLLILAAVLLGATSVTAAGQSTPPAKRSGPVPAAVFAEKPWFAHLALSPDGTRVAAMQTVGAKVQIIVLPVTGANREPRYFDIGRSDIAGIDWAGPDRLLVDTATVVNVFGLSFPFTNLFLVDLQKGTHRALRADKKSTVAGDVLYLDPAGQWLLIAAPKTLGATPEVRRVDLETGAETVVEKARPGVWNWFADNAGVLRAGIAYKEDRWTMWYRDQPSAPLTKVRPDNVGGIKGAVDQLYFFPGENAGAIVTNARSDRFAAYRFDFRTGEIGDAIFEHPKVDVTAIVANPVTRKIAGVSFEDERTHTEWLEPGNAHSAATARQGLPRQGEPHPRSQRRR